MEPLTELPRETAPAVGPPGAEPADPAGYADWVRPHLATMARLAARLAPAADRDDIVQEALVRAWVKRRQYDPARGTPAAWLLAITADQAGKARARAAPRPQPRPDVAELADARAVQVDPADPAGRVDLDRALDRLTDRQRLAVDCVYFAGLTVAETAAVMACAEGTVKSTLSDARARLRAILEVDR